MWVQPLLVQGVGMGHTLKDATANQHPQYGKLTHKEGCVGAGPPRPMLFHVQRCRTLQGWGRAQWATAGQRGIPWVPRMFLKLHLPGSAGTDEKAPFLRNYWVPDPVRTDCSSPVMLVG